MATGLGSLIAIVDTGIDQSHPDLQATVTDSFDATDSKQRVSDPHGTAIAGIITAHGAIEGVAPEAKLLDVRVFEPEAGGAGSIASTHSFVAGIAMVSRHPCAHRESEFGGARAILSWARP